MLAMFGTRPKRLAGRTHIIVCICAYFSMAPAVLAASCDTSKAPVVPIIKGLPYLQARTAIMADGWQAVPGHPHNDLSANEATFRDRGYTELQYCRMSNDSPCKFEYAAGGIALWITTVGDEDAMLSTQAKVKSAELGCVGEPAPS